jgi:hypothetical protein
MYRTRYGNKYGAIKTELNGYKYDSKHEASVREELDERLARGEIAAIDNQYKVEIPVYDEKGNYAFTVSHKVDFRVTNLDKTYTLVEAKGVHTSDYLWRRKFLEKIFLPNNLDYEYEVVYAKGNRRVRH